MTICKIDFGAFTGNATLKARLDRLNTYGSSGTHNGYLVEFDDYSDVTSTSQNTTLFAGGYPLKTMGPDTPESIYSDSTVKFQKQLFKNNKPNYFSNLNSMISYFDWYAGYYGLSTVYNAKHTLQSNGCLFSPDWEGEKNYDPATPFGGGASGSLAIKASDPSDVTTYKASGIYWGGWHPSSSATWWFEPYFSPFTLNFGKNINEITYLNIIDQFMNSAAFTTNTPTDDCCYTAS